MFQCCVSTMENTKGWRGFRTVPQQPCLCIIDVYSAAKIVMSQTCVSSTELISPKFTPLGVEKYDGKAVIG